MTSPVFRVPYPNGSTFEVDMDPIYRLDARKVEIPTVTKTTGAELMRAMEAGHGIAGKLLATVGLEAARMQEAINKRSAVVVLDEVPAMLKAKGLATARSPGGSEDQRTHALNLDETLSALKDAMAQLEALKALLKTHVQGFIMAFSAIKRVLDTQYVGIGNRMAAGDIDSNQFVSRSVTNYQDDKLSQEAGIPIGTPRY